MEDLAYYIDAKFLNRSGWPGRFLIRLLGAKFSLTGFSEYKVRHYAAEISCY
jgi:hypothetical protein